MVFKTGHVAARALHTGSKIKSIDLDSDDSDIIGSAKYRLSSSSSDITVRGRPITLSPVDKRISKFRYASAAFAANADGTLPLYWHIESKFISFELDLRDKEGQLFAKLDTRNKEHDKTMSIELFGPKAWDSLVAEEVLVTGMTVFIAIT